MTESKSVPSPERELFEEWARHTTVDDPLDFTPCDNPSCRCGFHYVSPATAWAYEAFRFGRSGVTPLQDAYITLEFERETDGRWIAEFPHAPGCLAYGQTVREAAANAMNLLENAGESSVLLEAPTPDELIRIGRQMANCCFNCSQSLHEVTKRDRDCMAEVYKEWDEALRKFRALADSSALPKEK